MVLETLLQSKALRFRSLLRGAVVGIGVKSFAHVIVVPQNRKITQIW
jgi:uncharacterized membrane protein YagU involved in acid resistance